MAWSTVLEKIVVSGETTHIKNKPVLQNEYEKVTLRRLMNEKEIDIVEYSEKGRIKSIDNLVSLFAERYVFAKDFYHEIRECNSSTNKKLSYSLSNIEAEERKHIVEVASAMEKYGLITEYYYNKEKNYISCVVSSVPRVINFFNGHYLERYAAITAEETLKEFCDNNGYCFELLSNVKVKYPDDTYNELDLLFMISDNKATYQFFWCEIKSGNKFNNYGKYYEIGKKLGAVPDHLLLLNAELSDKDVMDGIKYFYEYYISDVKGFKDALNVMISKSFNGGAGSEV